MKNFIPVLLLCLLFIQCNIEDDSTVSTDDEMNVDIKNSIIIDVRDDYFNFNGSKIVYLSDQNGNIVASEQLSNFNQTILTADFDSNTYDLTILSEVFGQGGIIHTYMNVQPTTYTFQRTPEYIPNLNKFSLNISQAPPEVFIYAMTGGSGNTSFGYENDNGGTITVGGALETSPGDYFIIGELPQEPFPRYFWKENINPNDIYNVAYNKLPYATSIASTQFPKGTSMKLAVLGHKLGDLRQVRHFLKEGIGNIDGTLNTLFYPPNIFDYYETMASYLLNDIRYYNRTTSPNIRENIIPANFNLTIASVNVDSFEMTTTGNYDYFQSLQSYFNPSEDINVAHFIIGEQSSSVSYNFEKVFNTIFSENPAINASLLEHQGTSLIDLDFTNDYNDILQYRTGGSLTFPLYHEENVVTKRE